MVTSTSKSYRMLWLFLVSIVACVTASADELDRALLGAFQGPEQKFVNIFDHKFHVKPVEVIQGTGDTVTVVGVISHHLSLRPDDQINYRVTCKGGKLTDVTKEVNHGGFAQIAGVIGSAIAKLFGADIDPKKIEELGSSLGDLVDGSWESSCNFLVANIALRARPFVTPPEFDKGVIKKSVNPISYIPPHVWGDREFDGHGPDVSLSATTWKVNDYVKKRYEIHSRVYMNARETKSDWTTARGSKSVVLYRHNKPIKRIVSDSYSAASYRDRNHSVDVLRLSASELVNRFEVVGDTKGKEAGDRTGVTVHFNPIAFEECNEPSLIKPASDSVLGGSTATFYWNAGCTPITRWSLYIGTYRGGADILKKQFSADTLSATVSDLPTDGQKIYVKLWHQLSNGTWRYMERSYEAANLVPQMTSPDPGSTLNGPTTTFNWISNGANVSDFAILAGSSPGGADFFDSGSLGTQESVNVTGLPVNGSKIHIRLSYKSNGSWKSVDYEYTAFKDPNSEETVHVPEMLDPKPESTLSAAETQFSWTSNGAAVANYWMYVGTRQGYWDLFNSGLLENSQEVSITGLPVDGSTLHVRLWYRVNDRWKWLDYKYIAFTDPNGNPETALPEIVDPEPGSTLSGSEAEFSWESNGANIYYYWVFIGSRRGYSDLFSSGFLPRSSESVTAKGLPVDGTALHVRLWYWMKGSWQFIDSEYTAFTQ